MVDLNDSHDHEDRTEHTERHLQIGTMQCGSAVEKDSPL